MKRGNHTFSLKGGSWMPKALHIWKNHTVDREENQMPEFNLDLWIKNNSTADVRELISRELDGTQGCTSFG